jgi:RHS repeat-associated protein
MPYGGERVSDGDGGLTRGYIGQYEEGDDLSYLNARYYDSGRGQFLGQDPVFRALGDDGVLKALADKKQSYFLADPQKLNAYSYALNNPISNSDLKGLFAIGVGAGVNAEAGAGLYGATTMSITAYLLVNEDTGDASFVTTFTTGSSAGITGIDNISYPAKAPKNSGVLFGSASAGLSLTYAPDAKKPSDLGGVSNNKSITIPFVSFQVSDSGNQKSYTIAPGVKGPGSVSSYPTNTYVLSSSYEKQLTKIISTLQKIIKTLKSSK